MVGKCVLLIDELIKVLCRKMVLYLHHGEQWRLDLINGALKNKADFRPELNTLKHESKKLKIIVL